MDIDGKLNDLIARWDSGDGKPYKGSLIDWRAYKADPSNLGCMCAQGQVLHVIRGMSPDELNAIQQRKADELVMETLGISRGHAILLRQVNDSVDGAPSIVLTEPEKVLGEHAKLVLAFYRYLDTMTADDWQKLYAARTAAGTAARAAARDAARDAAWDAAWTAAWDAAAADAGADAWDAAGADAGADAWDAAGAAAWAANEIQGHEVLKKKGKPLFFLGLFGFKTIESLIDWAGQ